MEERIIVKKTDVPETKTRKAFLRQYFETTPATYDEHGNKTCEAMLNRSVSDVLLMVRERFPKTSLKAVVRILHELNKLEMLRLTYCNTIKKVVVLAKCRLSMMTFPEDEDTFITAVGRHYMDSLGVDGLTLKLLEDIRKEIINEQ